MRDAFESKIMKMDKAITLKINLTIVIGQLLLLKQIQSGKTNNGENTLFTP